MSIVEATDRTAETKTRQSRRKHPLPRLAPLPEPSAPTATNSAIPEELLAPGVKWDNVKPVDAATEEAMREEYLRGTTAEPWGFASHGRKKNGCPRFDCRRKDVRFLTDLAVEPLALLAAGRSFEAVARIGATSVEEIRKLVSRVEKIHGITLEQLRQPGSSDVHVAVALHRQIAAESTRNAVAAELESEVVAR